MNPQLLTINNITKICDDKYYLKPDNSLTEIQWYNHQINFIITNLDINIEIKINDPITGYRLSRNQIYNLLLNTFQTNKFNLKASISNEILKQYGLYKPADLPKDIYTFDSLGGESSPKIEYNLRANNILIPTKYIYGKIVEFNELRVKKLNKKTSLSKSSSRKSIRKTIKFNRYKNTLRSIQGRQHIKKTNNVCEKLGKLDWYKNSCYADSVLQSIFYNAIQNKDKLLYNTIMNFRYDGSLINNVHKCANNESQSVNILNKGLDILKNFTQEIETGKIFTGYEFLKYMTNCANFFSQNFANGGMHDSNEFLKNIFKLLNLKIEESDTQITYISHYDDIDKIITNVPNIYNSNYNLILTDGLGVDLFKAKKIVNRPSHIQSVNIINEMLIDEYRHANINIISALVVKSDPRQYIIDPLLKRYVLKSNKLGNSLKYNSIKVSINKFLLTRTMHKFNEEPRYYYYNDDIIDENPPFDLTERYYYDVGNKGNYDSYKKSSEMDESIGFRMSYRITEMILGNQSDYIVFNINRKYRSQLIINRRVRVINKFINIKIIPEEIITISSTNYKLSSIIMFHNAHYIAIILINNEYYLYDDNFTPPMTDYLYKIGTYNKIENFIYKGVNNIALRNSTNLFYSKI